MAYSNFDLRHRIVVQVRYGHAWNKATAQYGAYALELQRRFSFPDSTDLMASRWQMQFGLRYGF